MTDHGTSAETADVRFGGFRLFLLASCLLAAAAGWLERSSLLEGLIVVAVSLSAVLLLVRTARPSSPSDETTELSPATDTMVSRQRRLPRSRKRRLTELRLDVIDRQLEQHEQTLRNVAEATRQTQIDLTNRLDQLEQRLTDLQNTTQQQQAALQQTRQQHMQQLHQTLAQLATTLEQDTEPASHDG